MTAEYTSSREQFDHPIASFQAVSQRAGDAYIDAEGVRLTAWQAAWRIADGLDAADEVAAALGVPRNLTYRIATELRDP